ncbi:hypothetical protein FNV43_RR08693 [Rhamnella rubrinervis]|uniref:Uncharacterized protein n=1 Tax=Rhamnella rubrinervis TaxID=2594499 RepID=A0A8K0H921_9ROSA|nr:hypothetical protein FNV43_RR08693 [Rhamnella rubrinervis]
MFSAANNPENLPQKSLLIKQDDKFYSRLLSKETSIANSSFRVYYGGLPGAVPFLWESQPGTPKSKFSDDTLPPLTPPPSYYTNNYSNTKPLKKTTSRSNILQTLFPKRNTKKTQMPSSPSQSSSPSFWSSPSSDSSSMVYPINTSKCRGRSRFSSPSSSFDSLMLGDDDEEHVGSPTSTLCFGFRRVTGTGGLRAGCYRF